MLVILIIFSIFRYFNVLGYNPFDIAFLLQTPRPDAMSFQLNVFFVKQ